MQITCDMKECVLRHPKLCRYYEKYGFCKRFSDCAYSHRVSHQELECALHEIRNIKTEIEGLKVEMAAIKNNVDEKSMETAINGLKSEITNLQI